MGKRNSSVKRPRHRNHYKTAVKVPIADVLCTRVRATIVFSVCFGKTFLARTCVQTFAFWEHFFDFESGFVMKFESITKPEREAQNDHLEQTISILSRRLQRFSKRAHEICYKTADFWGRRYQRPNPLDKNRALENMCAKPEGEHDFERKTLQMRAVHRVMY